MNKIAILDTETSSLDPATGELLEVAIATYSIPHRSVIRVYSAIVQAKSNEAHAINGISPALVSGPDAKSRLEVVEVVRAIARPCAVVVAHGAAFDRKWLPELAEMRWACSMDDIEWPRKSGSKSLAGLALAHGVGVASAHRALDDVMTLARLFERVGETHDVEAMLTRAMRPKKRFIAQVSYDTNALAKERGFKWNPDTKTWWKDLVVADIPAMDLPFEIREVSA